MERTTEAELIALVSKLTAELRDEARERKLLSEQVQQLRAAIEEQASISGRMRGVSDKFSADVTHHICELYDRIKAERDYVRATDDRVEGLIRRVFPNMLGDFARIDELIGHEELQPPKLDK